jgi:hypothetical protein
MRFRRDRAQRRPPQDILGAAIERQKICQIGVPAGELLERNLAASRKVFAFEVSGECGEIELLFGTDCAGIG